MESSRRNKQNQTTKQSLSFFNASLTLSKPKDPLLKREGEGHFFKRWREESVEVRRMGGIRAEQSSPSAPCSPVKPKSVETPLNEGPEEFWQLLTLTIVWSPPAKCPNLGGFAQEKCCAGIFGIPV